VHPTIAYPLWDILPICKLPLFDLSNIPIYTSLRIGTFAGSRLRRSPSGVCGVRQALCACRTPHTPVLVRRSCATARHSSSGAAKPRERLTFPLWCVGAVQPPGTPVLVRRSCANCLLEKVRVLSIRRSLKRCCNIKNETRVLRSHAVVQFN
jgi:hypothetical protein